MIRKLSITHSYRIIFSMVVILMTAMLFSCENDMMTVVKLTAKDSIPDIAIYDVNVKQSEKGLRTLDLIAPKMISFQTHDAYTEFPKGIKIIFYDSLMQPKSELTANYGISWDNRRTMQARGNVIVKNFQKNEQLNTESLVYDQNSGKASTDEFVKITQPDKTIYGKGMESDQLFANWVIRDVKATIYVEENK